jgi:hypothetical protein
MEEGTAALGLPQEIQEPRATRPEVRCAREDVFTDLPSQRALVEGSYFRRKTEWISVGHRLDCCGRK